MFRSKGHLMLQEQEEVRQMQTIIYELLENSSLDIDQVREEFLSMYPEHEALFSELIEDVLN